MTNEVARLVTDQEGNVLLAEHADTPFNPASLTKMMVLYLAFRRLPLSTMITVPKAAVVNRVPGRVPQTNMGLREGQVVSVADLVLGMILPSANDAAVTIAHHFGADDFVSQLNKEAAKLGLKSTHFATPSGIGKGTTTARDMALLARRLWQDYPAYRSFFSIGSFVFNGKTRRNTNELLSNVSGVLGMKTGTTAGLRRNLATVVQRDGKTVFAVVLNAADKAERDNTMVTTIDFALERLQQENSKVLSAAPKSSVSSVRHLEEEETMGLQTRPLLGTVEGIAEFLGAKIIGNESGQLLVSRIITSAVNVNPGDIYVPISAAKSRRQALAERAVERGAVAVMSSGNIEGDFPIIEVPRLDHALRELATLARSEFKGKVIGVTGSVGKTTTKDMIALVLSYCGSTNHTTANLNSGNANLAAVASLPINAAYSVLEIAMMDQGAVRRKSAVVKPDVAVITSIGLSHGSHHAEGGADSILIGKTEMFFELAHGGTAVLPSGDARYEQMVARASESGRVGRIISCGKRDSDDVRLLDAKLRPTCSEVTIMVGDTRVDYLIGQPGAHFVMNSLLVAGVLLAVGGSSLALAGLTAYTPTARRVERFRAIPKAGCTIELIDDAYNAAPDSVVALLELLKLREKVKRKILVLGDMLELGPDEVRHHLELAPKIEEAGIDLLITVGPKAAMVADAVQNIETIKFKDAKSAAKKIRFLLQDRDLIAVKGSNGMSLVTVVMAILGSRDARVRQDYRWSIEVEPANTSQFPTHPIRVVVSGNKVQGVGYRVWLQREARARAVQGFVRNRSDGAVEAVLFCAQTTLDEMLTLMRQGPEKADVTELVTENWTRELKDKDFLRYKAVSV
ncbi:Mur ligase family protein [Halomonas sp. KG2]|uniref:Mur ligase family protein n=1 Tax=unclassified Halomonas TaxID=2609666 RepID=UPI00264A00BB|nr:Mur ligase family protein [Halomonas sp. KG2]WKD27054.1 Mur ligase family protein [Halomonas sp. KG2]